MARMALSPWKTSDMSQEEYYENLRMLTACPECKEASAEPEEDFHTGDIICTTCGLVLADRILDTRDAWNLSFKTEFTDSNYSASYPDTPVSDCTVTEYPASNHSKNQYSSSEQADNDYQGNAHQDQDYQGNYGWSSARNGSSTPVPNTTRESSIVMQHRPDVSAMPSGIIRTIDVAKASLIPDQVRSTHSRLWSLRYPARSFQHRMDHLKKRIAEGFAKWQRIAGKIHELDCLIVGHGPSNACYQTWLGEKVALVTKMESQVEEIRENQLELELNQDMLDCKEDGRRCSVTLLSIA